MKPSCPRLPSTSKKAEEVTRPFRRTENTEVLEVESDSDEFDYITNSDLSDKEEFGAVESKVDMETE